MKEIVKINHLQYEINQQCLFKCEKLSIQNQDIIGIIGRNGSGKSTLLKILLGEINDYQGTVERSLSNNEMSYLEQESANFKTRKSVDYSKSSFKKTWNKLEGYETLSGGEKLKKRLAEAFATQSKLLILDEPTNHLDESSIEQLLIELKKYTGAVVIVSHNRYFLDEIATKIWSIENQEVKCYQGNYSYYKKQCQLIKESQAKAYEKQQKEIKKVKQKMKQLEDWSHSAHSQSTKKEGYKEYYRSKAKRMDTQRKSSEKRLQNQLDKKKVDSVRKNQEVSFDLQTTRLKNGRVVSIENLSKSYKDKVIFAQAESTIFFGDKVAITGENGCGKSTLLKILMQQVSFEGKVWISDFASIGYLSQDVFDLPSQSTMQQYLNVPTSEETYAKTLIVHLGFQSHQWLEKIADFSMGERIKIKLMKYILSDTNLLILDEPTNHLDIPSREALEEVLNKYKGTLIFVSHDRYFREKIAEKTYKIANHKIINMHEIKKVVVPVDEILLKYKKDDLISKLSILSTTSKEYQEAEKELNDVVRKLKESKEGQKNQT